MNTATPTSVTIFGNGGWGNAIAVLLARKGMPVTVWGHDADHLAECARLRENKRYLPGVSLPEHIRYETDVPRALGDSDVALCAVPTRYIRAVFSRWAGTWPTQTPLVSLSKGIERETLLFPTQILRETCGAERVAVLTGPSMAEEVALGLPAGVTLACTGLGLARDLQRLFNAGAFRVYASDDVVGCELGGAVKNVIAIAAGICDGMKLGDSAKAALVARGLAEIRRLGAALGAKDETFAGLSGIGDLYVTCASPHGRNRGYGERLGGGQSPENAAQAGGGMAIEGVDTALSLRQLAGRHDVDMPICEAVYRVIYERVGVPDALEGLLSRDLKIEDAL